MLSEGKVDDDVLQKVKLGTPQEQIASIQKTHADSMRVYEQKFESNHLLNFFDLWEYVERKLETEDGVTLVAHPRGNEPHPSASASDPSQAYLSLKMANEIDSISDLSASLETLIECEHTP